MRRFVLTAVLASLLAWGAASAANARGHSGRHTSTPQDTQAVSKVIEDFQGARKTKVADRKWKIASVMWTMNRPPK